MKFKKENISMVKNYDAKSVCFNYLDGIFVVSKFYPKENKQAMADFIKYVKEELKKYNPAKEEKVKIKKIYKGGDDSEIIELAEVLQLLSGWYINLEVVKDGLLEGHEFMTSFSYFKKI